MERLVTTSEAAHLLGISLQGVHYRIKNKKLKSIKEGNKTLVYVPDIEGEKKEETIAQDKIQETNLIISLKDEQIYLLKKSIKLMKRQYISEISRLESSHDKVLAVFNREIELLQSAFNEMRSVYKQPLVIEKKDKYISTKEFSGYLRSNGKSVQEIKFIVLEALRRKDKRFVLSKNDKKILILNEDFSDLI
ncbi:MAG: helix-turn-helix domain-containing protein [Campylobacteraceae bacterium]|nr:helix-turn-helix domain-containing protein [Campylobacteraceae bacterium]